MNLFHPKPALLSLLLLWQTAPHPARSLNHSRYQRTVALSLPSTSNRASAQICAVLDAAVFAHAAPTLKDLRLYSGLTEVPYVITISEPPQQDTENARILNLRTVPGGKSRRLLFELEMPHRTYTSIVLDLAPRDFIGTATLSGSTTPDPVGATPLGAFTLFDLTSQHLSHSLTIAMPESTYSYLHLQLALTPAPGNPSSSASLNTVSAVNSVTVPPSREAQSLYVNTQRSTYALQQGQKSVYSFSLPAHIPIEQVTFTLPPAKKQNFSRNVSIEAHSLPGDHSENAGQAADVAAVRPEAFTGNIFQVHQSEAGHDISAESLEVPVAIGSNMQQSALVEVAVDNDEQPPLPLTVTLQMRQRRICFDAALVTGPLSLEYGNPSLEAPSYKDASLDSASTNPRTAILGPESVNANFTAAPLARKLVQHPPILRWIALLGCICIFALLVIRRNHRRQH